MAGVPYDGFTAKESGKGKWWDGFDPQQLYTGPNMVMPKGITSIAEAHKWHAQNDRVWNENPPPNNPRFTETWFLRCKELLDKYQPDLLYFLTTPNCRSARPTSTSRRTSTTPASSSTRDWKPS
jgi:alpha-L-fucosidase